MSRRDDEAAETPQDSAGSADGAGEVDQPGLRELREAVAYAREHLPRGSPSVRRDAIAGLNTAIANVPDGMANAVIVGVNPIYGLYATTVGPLVGGVLSSTRLMVITTTAAASLTAGQSLTRVPAEDRPAALFMMVVLTGAFQLLFGLLRLGTLARFVSYSVSVGLLTGIAVLLVLSQLSTVTGYDTEGSNRVAQAGDLLVHLDEVHGTSLTLALVTLVLAVALPRTRVGKLGRLLAIIVPSILVAVFNWDGVAIVSDIGDIPRGIPSPSIPRFEFWLDVVTGALSLAVVILVQAAGVSQSVPNPDGSRTVVSRDFVAQGAANMAGGFFRGLPVGGSMSATALSVLAGAASRWAAVFAGLWMAIIVVVFPSAVSQIAMPALGALLILAGVSSIKPMDLAAVANAGWPSVLAAATTFLAALFLPIQSAVAIGVVLAALLFLTKTGSDIAVVELVHRPDGEIEERSVPSSLTSGEVTVLDVYGNLFYAGARTLERLLPAPDAEGAALVIRLRGRSTLGATLVDVLSNYADRLAEHGGRLYLAGIGSDAHEQILRSGRLQLDGPIRAYPATAVLGQSTGKAVADARAWLRNSEGASDSSTSPDVS